VTTTRIGGRLVVLLIVTLGIPILLTAEYWALGRLSVFRLDASNPFLLPVLQEVADTGHVPEWSPVMGGGTFTRVQSRQTLSPLPLLTKVVGPIHAYQLLYVLAVAVASAGAYLFMRGMVDCGVVVGLAAAYIYANLSFEQLAIAPEYVVFMLTPVVLLVFMRIVPRSERVTTKAALVVTLSLVLVIVGDFARETIWLLTAFTPIVLLYPRPSRWSNAGWWVALGVLTTALCLRDVYAIAAFNAWSDRAYFTNRAGLSTIELLLTWARAIYYLALAQRQLLAVILVFLALVTYLQERDIRRAVVRRILTPLLLLVLMDLLVWVGTWWLRDRDGGVVARSLSMRMNTVVWAYAPLAALLIAGRLPRELGITLGKRWVASVSTTIVLAMLASSAWIHASRIKENALAWLDNRTIGFYLDSEPLRRLRAEDRSVFRVAAVQSRPVQRTDLQPGYLQYYGFETSDSVFSNHVHALRQFWGLVVGQPSLPARMDLYLIAPMEAGGIRFDETFSLPLLSLMNTKYFVARAPLVDESARLAAVHTPRAPRAETGPDGPVGRFMRALRLNRDGGDFYIYRNLDVFDRAFLVSAVRSFPDERTLLDALASATTAELRAALFVLARDADRLGRLEPDPSARVTLERYTGSALEMAVSSRGPTVLVVSNTFGPWWRCRGAGGPLDTFAAYHAWVGVRLEAGDQRVTCFIDPAPIELLPAGAISSPWGGGEERARSR
jgi:hypothetical protein